MHALVKAAYFSNSKHICEAHHHDCHQIILILKGDIQYTMNEVTCHATRGDIVISSRYEEHSVQVLSEEYERYVLRLSPFSSSASNRLYALLSNRPRGFKNVLSVSDGLEDFEYAFSRIVNENRKNRLLANDMLESLINQLFIMIYRLIPKAAAPLDDVNFKMVSDIQNKFEESYHETYTLDSLAKEYHISVSTLSHQFKSITGMAVMEYLLFCRLASAKKYLSETNMNVGEIVEKCGFSDTANFCRTFKKMNGVTPLGFRTQYKENRLSQGGELGLE